jgi:hypothetical protein
MTSNPSTLVSASMSLYLFGLVDREDFEFPVTLGAIRTGASDAFCNVDPITHSILIQLHAGIASSACLFLATGPSRVKSGGMKSAGHSL